MVRASEAAASGMDSRAEGRFAVDGAQRVTEWDQGAATVLEVPERHALGRPCHEVVGGSDDFGRLVCGPNCPALRALHLGHIMGSSTMVVRSRGGGRLRLRCELTALPSIPGGALGRIHRSDDPSSALVHDLAGVATLTAKVSGVSLRDGVDQALDFLLETSAAEAAEVFLTEPGGRGMMLTCHRGRFRRAFAQILRFNPGEGFPGLVLARGEPVYTDQLADDSRYLRTRVKQQGFRSYVCSPLTDMTDVVGSIGLAFRRPDVDLDRTLSLLHWVGAPLGLLVVAAMSRVREAVDAQFHRDAGDPERHFRSTIESVLKEMVHLGGSAAGELYLLPENPRIPWPTEGLRPVPHCPVLQEGLFSQCSAFAEGRGMVLCGPRASWPPPCQRTAYPSGTWYCIPLLADDGPISIVRLLYRNLRRSLPSQDMALLESAAAAAAAGVCSTWDSLERARSADTPLRAWLQQAATGPDTLAGPALERAQAGVASSQEGSDVVPLEVRCFGTFELYVQGKAITPAMVHRRKALKLLKVLVANNGRAQPKDTLIEALWPDADPDTRTSQFYVLVHELRQLVEPGRQSGGWTFIHNAGDRYYFNPQSPCWIDAAEFQMLLDLGRKREAAGEREEAIGTYEKAVALYRGDFMEDEPFADWCWQERERLRETCLEALRSLAALQGERGRWERSIRHLRHALVLDQLREEVHRELMYALWAAGRRGEAVRQYGLCAGVLRDELGLEPLPETERLLQRVRASPRPT